MKLQGFWGKPPLSCLSSFWLCNSSSLFFQLPTNLHSLLNNLLTFLEMWFWVRIVQHSLHYHDAQGQRNAPFLLFYVKRLWTYCILLCFQERIIWMQESINTRFFAEHYILKSCLFVILQKKQILAKKKKKLAGLKFANLRRDFMQRCLA